MVGSSVYLSEIACCVVTRERAQIAPIPHLRQHRDRVNVNFEPFPGNEVVHQRPDAAGGNMGGSNPAMRLNIFARRCVYVAVLYEPYGQRCRGSPCDIRCDDLGNSISPASRRHA